MIGLALRVLLAAALLGAPVGYLALNGLPTLAPAPERDLRPAAERPVVGEGLPRRPPRRAPAEPDARRDAAGAVARAGLGLGLAAFGLVACRLLARSRRRVERYRVVVPRADRPEPERVALMIESLHRIAQRERALARLLLGQEHLALEWHSLPDRAGSEVVLCVVCPPGLAPDVDAALSACYPNARLGREFSGPPLPWGRPVTWTRRMTRLRKGRSTLLRAAGVEGAREGASVLEAAMVAACARPVAAGVQIRLLPAPALAERLVHRRLRARERSLDANRRRELAPGPGLGGPLARGEAEGALELAHQGAFWSEVWVLADDAPSLRAVAGTLQAAGGEAPLRRRRAWSPLHRRRVPSAMPGPLCCLEPLFAPEIACLWRLPSPSAGSLAAGRSSLPRLPAPAEVERCHPVDALVLDERGGVRLRAAEKPLGLGLVGLQGTGKTSALIASVAEDARDPAAALIVLDPKSDLAAKALSVIPAERRVWHLDFARPEFGINPLLSGAGRDAVADAFIGALTDLNEDGAIRASSDRYLRFAVAGVDVLAAERGVPPTVWLVHELLDPDAADLRAAVGALCRRDPDLVHAAIFFERSLPDQLQSARSQTTVKLDAPSNKLQRLLGKTADQVLHHPVQVSIAEVIARREVLIVDGAMGSVGPDTSSKLMQILLRLVFAALQRQQELPEGERVRVALKVDEAHYTVNRTLARMMAVGRSAGLELVAAWQHSEQFADPEVRAAMDQLLRHRITFAAGEEDARAAAVQAMAAYTDVIRDDAGSRELHRVLPDVIRLMPQHHAVCSWVVEGRRADPFVGRTRPAEEEPERLSLHREAQRRRRVGDLHPHHPPELPNPLGGLDAGEDEVRGPARAAPTPTPSGTRERFAHVPLYDPPGRAEPGPRPSERPAHDTEAPSLERATEAGRSVQGGSGTEAADVQEESAPPPASVRASKGPTPPEPGGVESFREAQIDDPTGIFPEEVAIAAAPREPRPDELQVLRLLHRARFLLGTQIAREVGWQNERSGRRILARLASYGWIRRHRLRTATGGRPRSVYTLTRAGFEAGRALVGRVGSHAPPEAAFSEPAVTDPRRVVHDLRAAGYALALARALGPDVRDWQGERSRLARPQPPMRGRGDDRRPILARELPLARDRAVGGLRVERFEPVHADAMIELRLERDDGPPRRLDLFVELDRTRRPGKNFAKFRRYDALITAWAMTLPRYGPPRELPAVVFCCEDEEHALAFLRAADAEVTGHISRLRTPEEEWAYPGRERIHFTCERDAHEGSLRAWRLPELPGTVRRRLGQAAEPEPFQTVLEAGRGRL